MRKFKTRLAQFVFMLFFICTLGQEHALAHGGQYNRPSGGSGVPGPGPGNPRSGGVTPSRDPSWLNWWDRNREDYYDVRKIRLEKSGPNEGGNGKYAKSAADHQGATKDDTRNMIVPTLLGAANDKSPDVRDATGIALGRAGEIPVVATLKKLLGDNNRRVRQGAILGLGLLRHPMAQHVLGELLMASDTAFKERGMAAIALGLGGGDKAEEKLLRKIGSRQPFGRLSSIKTRQVDGCRALGLGLLGRSENASALIAALKKNKSKDKSFAAMALVGLAKLGDPLSAAAGLQGLKAKDNDTRRGAAILLGRTVNEKNKKTVKTLLKHWKKERDAHARYFLSISLGRIGGDEILAALNKNLLRNKNREDRAFSALALGIAHDYSAAPILEKILAKERDVSLRSAMAISLAIMDHKNSAPLIFKTLKETKNYDLRASLITALAMLDFKEALPEIRKILGRARNERLVRSCGFAMAAMYDADSLKQMLATLRNSGSIQVKGGMASALGRTGDRRVIEPLVKLIKTKAETDLTRAFAIVALGLVGDKSDKSEFSRVSIDSNYAMVNAQAFLEVIDIF